MINLGGPNVDGSEDYLYIWLVLNSQYHTAKALTSLCYKKPMASKHAMLQHSAITEKCKIFTAVQELIRS